MTDNKTSYQTKNKQNLDINKLNDTINNYKDETLALNNQLDKFLTIFKEISLRNSCLEDKIVRLMHANKDLMEKNNILTNAVKVVYENQTLSLIANIKVEKLNDSNENLIFKDKIEIKETEKFKLEIKNLKSELENKNIIIDQIMTQSNKYQLDLMQKTYENDLIKAKNKKLAEKNFSFATLALGTNDRY